MITPQLFRLICVLGPSIISLATTGVINTQVSNIADEISNNFLENNNQSAQTSLQVNRAHAIGAIASAVGLMPVKIVVGTLVGATKGAFGPVVGPIINLFNNKASVAASTISESGAEAVTEIASDISRNILIIIARNAVDNSLTITTGSGFGTFIMHGIFKLGTWTFIFIITHKFVKILIQGITSTYLIVQEHCDLKAQSKTAIPKVLDKSTKSEIEKEVIDV